MKALAIAVPGGILATAILWWLVENLSSDAVAMAIGMTLGVLAGVPTAALVLVARRRDDEDDWQPTIIDYPPPVYADQVTPYTHLFRRAARMPQLPDRQAEIDILRSALDYLEAQEV